MQGLQDHRMIQYQVTILFQIVHCSYSVVWLLLWPLQSLEQAISRVTVPCLGWQMFCKNILQMHNTIKSTGTETVGYHFTYIKLSQIS